MKRVALAFAACASALAFAKAAGPVSLGAAMFADTEASTNVPPPACGRDPHMFGFSLEFYGTASNAVDVAFGEDTDGDGALAPEETCLVMGWDCGEWFVQDEIGGARQTESAVAAMGAQVLRVSVRAGRGGRVSAVDIRAGDAPLFVAFSSAPPAWLHDCSWNLCRIASHGVDAHGTSFSVSATPDGMQVIVR